MRRPRAEGGVGGVRPGGLTGLPGLEAPSRGERGSQARADCLRRPSGDWDPPLRTDFGQAGRVSPPIVPSAGIVEQPLGERAASDRQTAMSTVTV